MLCSKHEKGKCNCFSRKNSAYAKPAIALANDGFNGENTNGIFNKEEGSQNNPEIRILELEKQMSVVKRERDQLILEKENTKKWIRKKAEEVEKKMKEYEEEAKKKGIEAEELMQKFGRAVINEWNKDRDERNHLWAYGEALRWGNQSISEMFIGMSRCFAVSLGFNFVFLITLICIYWGKTKKKQLKK